MINSISDKLLTNSVSYFEKQGINADREFTYSDEIVLSNVWINQFIGNAESTLGKSSSDFATIYFDCHKSLPRGFIPKLNSKVVYEQKEHQVRSFTVCRTGHGVHHFEITIV